MTIKRLVIGAIGAIVLVVVVLAALFFSGVAWLNSQVARPPSTEQISRAEESLSRLPGLPESLVAVRSVVDEVQRAVEDDLGIRFATESSKSPRTSCGDYVLDATRAEVGVDAVRRAGVLVTQAQWFAAVSAAERALGPRAVRAPGSPEYFVEYRVPDVGTIAMSRTAAGGGFVTIKGETECRLP